jgi:putative acetyltransferase
MRTDPNHLRKGVAGILLQHIINEAQQRKYQRISLETSYTFKPAMQLYERYGFVICEPFADYIEDTNSVFMSLKL